MQSSHMCFLVQWKYCDWFISKKHICACIKDAIDNTVIQCEDKQLNKEVLVIMHCITTERHLKR